MLSHLSRIIGRIEVPRGAFTKVSKIFDKADIVGALPWRSTIAVIAVAFALATVLSVMVGQLILDRSMPSPRAERTEPAVIAGPEGSITRSAVKEIIKRNIFNSEGKTAEDVLEDPDAVKRPASDAAVKTTLPIKVLGIIYGGDPYSGIAVIEDTSKQSINSFMYKDVMAKGAIMLEILEDRVIFDRDGSKEYAELYREETKKQRRTKKGPVGDKEPARGNELSPLATTPPPNAYKEEGFERDKNKIVMTTDFKQRMLTGDFAKVLQDAKAEPYLVDGELRGFKLTRIRQDSIYEKAGLQNEDVISEINGTSLTDTGQAIKYLNSLRNESTIELRILRGGTPMNVVIEIR